MEFYWHGALMCIQTQTVCDNYIFFIVHGPNANETVFMSSNQIISLLLWLFFAFLCFMFDSLMVFMNFFLLGVGYLSLFLLKDKTHSYDFFNLLLVSFSSLITFVIHSSLSPERTCLSVHWLLVLILMNCSPGIAYSYHLRTFLFGFFSFFHFR